MARSNEYPDHEHPTPHNAYNHIAPQRIYYRRGPSDMQPAELIDRYSQPGTCFTLGHGADPAVTMGTMTHHPKNMDVTTPTSVMVIRTADGRWYGLNNSMMVTPASTDPGNRAFHVFAMPPRIPFAVIVGREWLQGNPFPVVSVEARGAVYHGNDGAEPATPVDGASPIHTTLQAVRQYDEQHPSILYPFPSAADTDLSPFHPVFGVQQP